MKGPCKGTESDKMRAVDVSQFGFWLFASAFFSWKPNIEQHLLLSVVACGNKKPKHSLQDLACVGKW